MRHSAGIIPVRITSISLVRRKRYTFLVGTHYLLMGGIVLSEPYFIAEDLQLIKIVFLEDIILEINSAKRLLRNAATFKNLRTIKILYGLMTKKEYC